MGILPYRDLLPRVAPLACYVLPTKTPDARDAPLGLRSPLGVLSSSAQPSWRCVVTPVGVRR